MSLKLFLYSPVSLLQDTSLTVDLFLSFRFELAPKEDEESGESEEEEEEEEEPATLFYNPDKPKPVKEGESPEKKEGPETAG